MAALTKAELRAALQLKGVPVPPGSYKKDVLVRLYREHVPGSEARLAAGLDFSSDEDEEPHAPLEDVSPEVRLLSNDDLFAKLQQFGYPVGPIVDSTRGVYEKRLQQFLSSHSPARPSGPEFSASEEEEEEGTPLQDAPVSRLGRVSGPNSSRRGEGGALYSPGRSRGGGKEDVPVVSRTSTTFTMAGTPARGTLRARAGNTGSPLSTMMAKASNSSRRDVQGQARKARGAEQAVVSGSSSGPSRGGLSPGAQVAAVVLLVAACLLVYANLEYFKADVPVPSVVHP
ncbi:uncharacterized protein LOC144151501 isoform X1 [Haemaphysalis longicornis]